MTIWGKMAICKWVDALRVNDPQPKVTVYVPCRNYGKFLEEALESIATQSLTSWELYIFTEGSEDDTNSIAQRFADQYPGRVHVIVTEEPIGLRACANKTLDLAKGEHIIRLDADDYLDENALLILSSYLDNHQDVGLVYPNWIYITEAGDVMGVERRKRLRDEDRVLDLPAHGACTMIRKRVLKAVGGYDTRFSSQDGHELWMRTLHRFNIANVQTPLFYYRQHSTSMSTNAERLLSARRAIKRAIASRYEGPVKPRRVAIIPVKNTYAGVANVALTPLAGRPLIDYTLECSLSFNDFDLIYVSTDDCAVLEYCQQKPGLTAQLREPRLSDPDVNLHEVIEAATRDMESRLGFYPDIIAVLNVHTPLRRPEHIEEALDTLMVYEVDQVVSTYEDHDLHFQHGKLGLEPINIAAHRNLRLEREALFTSNGAVHVFWRDVLQYGALFQGRIGHIVMSRTDSLQAKYPEDRARAETVLMARAEHQTAQTQELTT